MEIEVTELEKLADLVPIVRRIMDAQDEAILKGAVTIDLLITVVATLIKVGKIDAKLLSLSLEPKHGIPGGEVILDELMQTVFDYKENLFAAIEAKQKVKDMAETGLSSTGQTVN